MRGTGYECGETTARGQACSSVGEIAVSSKDRVFHSQRVDKRRSESERLALLREFYRRGVVKAEVDPSEGQPLDGDLHLLCPAGSAIADGKVVWRPDSFGPRQLVVDGDDSLALVVIRSGAVGISARGRELLLGAGEAVLTSAEDAAMLRATSGRRVLLASRAAAGSRAD